MGADAGSLAGWGGAGSAGGAGGAVLARAARRGARSRPFRARDLLLALRHAPATVVVEEDGAGYLTAAGGAAALCARAQLALDVTARNALLTAAPRAGGDVLLQVELAAGVAARGPLRVWPDEPLRRALLLPHLAPHNIRGEEEYACHVCGARFREPNPLKAHLFLACAAPEPRGFWRALAARLAPSPSPAPSPASGAHPCAYCGKLYSRRYGLKIHIRTHTGDRPLRCRHCARAFGDPSNLNKHLRLHERRPQPRTRHARALTAA